MLATCSRYPGILRCLLRGPRGFLGRVSSHIHAHDNRLRSADYATPVQSAQRQSRYVMLLELTGRRREWIENGHETLSRVHFIFTYLNRYSWMFHIVILFDDRHFESFHMYINQIE